MKYFKFKPEGKFPPPPHPLQHRRWGLIYCCSFYLSLVPFRCHICCQRQPPYFPEGNRFSQISGWY